MAKISNITAYPNQSPVALTDYLIGTDNATKATKTFTVQDLANAIDDQVTLLEVLNASPNPIPGPADAYNSSSPWNGVINLGSNVIGIGNVAYISLDAGYNAGSASDRITLSNGHLKLNDVNSDVVMSGGEIKASPATNLNFTVPTAGFGYEFVPGIAGVGFNAGSIGTRLGTFSVESDGLVSIKADNSVTGDVTIIAGHNGTFNSLGVCTVTGKETIVNAGDTLSLITDGSIGSAIQIGGPASSTRPDDISIQAEDEINLKTFTGNSEFRLSGVDGITSFTRHKFEEKANFLVDIQANGASGNAGEVLTSGGLGNPTSWSPSSSLSVGSVKMGVHIAAPSTLANFLPGTPVFVSNTPSGPNSYPTVDYASPSPTVEMPAIGLIVTATAKGNDAEIMMSGELEVNTTSIRGAASINDIVYVDNYDAVTSPLCLTVTRPSGATTQVQNVGVITKTGANGSIKVSAVGRSNDLPNISANQIWVGNAGDVPEPQTALTVDVANSTVNVGNSSATSNTLMDTRMSAQVVYGDAAGSIGIKNLQYGNGSLQSAIVGSVDNTALGINSLQNLTTGISNVAVGNTAGNAITTTNNNIAIGNATLDAPAGAGNENVAVGGGSMGNTTGAGASSTVAIGHNALNTLTTGAHNTAVGHSVGFALTNGQRNVIIGRNANFQNGGDSDAVIIGHGAIGEGDSVCIGVSAEAGAEAVAVGREANAATPTTGSTAIGHLSSADVDCIALGKDANAMQRGANPMLAFPGIIANALANVYVYPDNNAAIAAGLQPGDVYCVDFSPSIPGWTPPPAGGPAVLALVY